MPGLRNILCLFAAAGIALLPACSRTPQGNRRPTVQNAFLVNSFPLRQGEFSAITCLAADSRGNVCAAGYSDYDCVVLKLDAELGTLLEMVRFGCARDFSYSSQDTIEMHLNSPRNGGTLGASALAKLGLTHQLQIEGNKAFATPKTSGDRQGGKYE
jgi:hypothetical protein